MNLFDDLFNTLPKEENKLSNAESYIQKRDAIQTTQDTEEPKSAIQPSKQFNEPVEPEITSQDTEDGYTYTVMYSEVLRQSEEEEIVLDSDNFPIDYYARNEAYYQFRRSKPDEYVSFRDWMQMQKEPLAEAFIGVVKPALNIKEVSPKKDYRDSMPPGLKELQDMNGINQPEKKDYTERYKKISSSDSFKENYGGKSLDTGQPDLFEDAIYKVISDNAFGDVKGKVAEDMLTVGQAMFKSYLDEDKPKIEYIDPISPIKRKLWVGIDPGKAGGIVAITEREIVGKWVMPLLGTDVDAQGLWDILDGLKKDYDLTLILEEVHSLHKMAAATNFSMGHTLGLILGIVISSKIRLIRVQPKAWQKATWITSEIEYLPKKPDQAKPSINTKLTSMKAAHRLFPNEDFRKSIKATNPHDGLCDAVLMAEYGRQNNL